MLDSSYETFIKKYQSSPKELQSFIDSDKIPKFLDELEKANLLNKSLRSNICNLLVDIVLGLKGLRAVLEGIRSDVDYKEIYSDKFASEVEKFLSETRSGNEKFNGDKKIENINHKLEEVRTYESDAHKAHGYGVFMGNDEDSDVTHSSSQDSVLVKKDAPNNSSTDNQ